MRNLCCFIFLLVHVGLILFPLSSIFQRRVAEGVPVPELHLKYVVLLGDACMKNRIGAKKNLLKKTP